jgi:hypothetical protein
LKELNDFEWDNEWALQSKAHAVSPFFANEEFWIPPSAERIVLFWRRRFEIPCDTKYSKRIL